MNNLLFEQRKIIILITFAVVYMGIMMVIKANAQKDLTQSYPTLLQTVKGGGDRHSLLGVRPKGFTKDSFVSPNFSHLQE